MSPLINNLKVWDAYHPYMFFYLFVLRIYFCRMVITKNTKDNKHWRMWRKVNPYSLLVGMKISIAIVENSVEVCQKSKTRIAIQSSNPTTGYISKGN
jgi:hypothetical protein